MKKQQVARGLVYASFAGVTLAAIGALGVDLILASTQWMLIGIMLAVWAIYLLLT